MEAPSLIGLLKFNYNEVKLKLLSREYTSGRKLKESCLIELVIREMQIETIVTYHLTPVRMLTIKKLENNNIGVDVEKLELLCTVGRTVKRYSCYGKQYGGFSEVKNRIIT